VPISEGEQGDGTEREIRERKGREGEGKEGRVCPKHNNTKTQVDLENARTVVN